MREEYASNEEYPAYFETLAGLRNRIAKTLPLKKDMYILHLATGQGYFSVEIAKRWKGIMVTGINLTEGNIE
jgi:cyclopropane fatty-acyl-phospholipid synthase-like methyltransferase